MSMTCTIELESGEADLPSEMDPNDEGLVYGQSIPYVFEWLATAAEKLGVRPLGEFITEDDVSDEPDPGSWIDAQVGLETIQSLLRFSSDHAPDPIVDGGSVVKRDDLLWDLRAYEAILFGAASSGTRFRLIAIY